MARVDAVDWQCDARELARPWGAPVRESVTDLAKQISQAVEKYSPTATERAWFGFFEAIRANPEVVSIADCDPKDRDHKTVVVTVKSMISEDAEALYRAHAETFEHHPKASLDIRITD